MDELLDWPYRRFTKAYGAWQRRRAAERIERQEDLHIGAMYANTNLDEQDNNRAQRVRDVQEYYRSVREQILSGSTGGEEPEAPDEQAELFMAAGRRSLDRVLEVSLPGEEVMRSVISS